MRVLHVFLLSLCMVLITLSVASGEQTDGKAPRATVAEPSVEFPTAMEGKIVTHAFVVRNEGEAVLDIQNIKTG